MGKGHDYNDRQTEYNSVVICDTEIPQRLTKILLSTTLFNQFKLEGFRKLRI